ncbi:MAG: response regulator transcription factor [Candidatus Promineifilaceae bacterium]
MNNAKILVVDDDMALAKTIEHILRDAHFQPLLAFTAEDGLALAEVAQPDLALLDVMVPSMGGWELCRQLREVSDMPILFLTALGHVTDVVKGLELGADDYLVKPFDGVELLARIKAHLRRAWRESERKHNGSPAHIFDNGFLYIDTKNRLVRLNGQPVEFTPREFDLLAVLAQRAGQVVPTLELVQTAWQLTDETAVSNIKPYIHYLRKKLETDPADPQIIQTVRGVGYRLVMDNTND